MCPSRGWKNLRIRRWPPDSSTGSRRRPFATSSPWRQDQIPPQSFPELITKATATRQIYISRSLDPYVNLSIEHYLLQKTPANSTILFLYSNRPCVVIGRNQNPWVEVNLPALGSSPTMTEVLLVRRRSGGGAVFHDEGNVNYSVICPTAAFHRDKHAEMIVRALRGLAVQGIRINARHDIVMDPSTHPSERGDGPEPVSEETGSQPLKVSGSAYKLTRLRALHHGTCLLSSPNLKDISRYLRSPAKPYIKARGVESVSSPIGNVGVPNIDFENAVVNEFVKMYGIQEDVASVLRTSSPYEREHLVAGFVGEAQAGIPEIAKGVDELKVRQIRQRTSIGEEN